MMFSGSIVALVSPMQADGTIDFDVLRNLVSWHIEQGTQSLVVAGTTGESASFSFEEYRQVVTTVVEETAGRIPVIAGTGTNSTQKTIELTQTAKTLGVDACLIVTPYAVKPTQAGLLAHYQQIAQSVAIPQILYNVPGRTACDLLPETVIALAKHPHIVGIKECVEAHYAPLIQALGDTFDILTGDDPTALAFFELGGHGVISVTGNILPALMREFCDAGLRGDFSKAATLFERLQVLNAVLFVESNPIPVKWALYRMGLIPSGIRLPLTPLSVQYRPLVEQAVEKVVRLS